MLKQIKRIIRTFSRGKLLLIILAIILLYQTTGDFIVSLKPARDFENVMAGEVSVGNHIKGEIPFLLDYFATEKSWTKNSNGSVTPKKTSAYYYIIPGNNDTYLGIRMRTQDYEDAEKLVEETYDYLLGDGNLPSGLMSYEGMVVKMEEEYSGLGSAFEEELSAYGYLKEEIEEMGEPLLIVRRDFWAVRGMFGAGMVLLLLVILWIGVDLRKANQWAKAKDNDEVIVVKRQD